ncbi:MAG: RNA polymerase sigma-70 factor [Macellibacteroides fermentans]|uniref:RNA polymerase sigma-70 factor n=1 Tax=Macellibacteroides fermentans TaxID=879969 RepID=UPI003AD26CFF
MNIKHKDKLIDKKEMVFFEKLFQEYYASLLSYANSFLNNKEVSEDITQDVFMSLWIKKNEINFDDPIKPYLYKSTYNKVINYLNSFEVKNKINDIDTVDNLINKEIIIFNQLDSLFLEEIHREIESITEELSPQCKKVFILSRKMNLKNKEIAEFLSISEKAVEKNITKALNKIRAHLLKMDLISLFFCIVKSVSIYLFI